MRVVYAHNVNDAFYGGLNMLKRDGIRQNSRAGYVLVMPFPVVTVYEKPQQRVLFHTKRDANPFFHLFESLWMLAGWNNAHWLDQFVHDFSERFAEEDGRIHGAYGHRWLRHFDMEGGGEDRRLPNQLDTIVELLKKNPDDRRIVLTMWDPVADLGVTKKDVPCNTQAYFRVRSTLDSGVSRHPRLLDMTVCCRSNDAVWGCLAGDTLIQSPEGNLSISRLAARFSRGLKRLPVYAVDPVTGTMAIKWCTCAWKTGVKPVRELVFKDGTRLRLTSDHILYLKKLKRGVAPDPSCIIPIKAGKLTVGNRIWAPALCIKGDGGYLLFKRNILQKSAFPNLRSVHGAYDELLYGPRPAGFEIHHNDENKLNNRSSNLIRLTKSAHMALHMRQKLAALSPEERVALAKKGSLAAAAAIEAMSPAERQALYKRMSAHSSETMRSFWARISVGERKRRAKVASEAAGIVNTREALQRRGRKGLKNRWADPKQRERQAVLMRRLNAEGRTRSNHLIVEINELPPEPVYDFTVEDFHTALVGTGILAHNCYGANAVHFSVLQEYLAARIGVRIGTYYQMSNNFHVYSDMLEKLGKVEQEKDYYLSDGGAYVTEIVTVPDTFDAELRLFMGDHPMREKYNYQNKFFPEVAIPLLQANSFWKAKRRTEALEVLGRVPPCDWRLAAQLWFERRMYKAQVLQEQLHGR